MSRWPIGRRVAATCVLLIVFVIASGAVSIIGTRRVGASLNVIATDSLPGILTLTEVQAAELEIVKGMYLLALPGLESYKAKELAHVTDLQARIPGMLKSYESGVSPEERSLYEQTTRSSEAFLQTCAHYRALVFAGKIQEAS